MVCGLSLKTKLSLVAALLMIFLSVLVTFYGDIMYCMDRLKVRRMIRQVSDMSVFKIRGIYAFPGRWPYKDEMIKLLDNMAKSGFNVILWYANEDGQRAYYKSKFYPYAPSAPRDVDPLKVLIEEAHRRGIKVWIWFSFMGYRDLVLRHPKWAAVYPNGTSVIDKPYRPWGADWYPLNPAHPEVQEFWEQAILELVENYDIDGINFQDDFGYIDSISYDYINKAMFEKLFGIGIMRWPEDVLPGGPLHKSWVEYKCRVITSFVKRLYRRVKSVKPNIVISLAVSSNLQWFRERGVDWVMLAREQCVDALTFMLYSDNTDWVVNETLRVMNIIKEVNPNVRVIPIIGYELRDDPPSKWIEQAVALRKAGVEDIIVFWARGIDSIKGCWEAFGELFSSMRRSAQS
ncbi:MAG: hypothetical protein DRJ66_04445 [Thermoprotei archaeon]|nr:MAG: hypothetical protein DRJ66_04445 [Thermoprotei archaeon]